MSKKKPEPALLFMGVLFSDENLREKAKEWCEKEWGKIHGHKPPCLFTHTHYYDEEMGTPIYREFWSFSALVPQEKLFQIKKKTCAFEKKIAVKGKRKVNLDPGGMNLARVMLLSTKDFYHRFYLGSGIYGEVTLYFQHGAFHPFPWTYPDYAQEEVRQWFAGLREEYKKMRR